MRWFMLLMLLLIACTPQPIDTTPTREAMQDAPKTINVNQSLALGECNPTSYYSPVWGVVWIKQCVPSGYTLYELRENEDGHHQPDITVGLNIDYTGQAYSLYPGGRAGRAGYTSEPVRFVAGCYAFKVEGQLHLWGEPNDYGMNIMVGEKQLQAKRLPANGMYEMVWFWLARSETLTPVTFYASFAWGSATADSYLTFERFQVEAVTVGHCG